MACTTEQPLHYPPKSHSRPRTSSWSTVGSSEVSLGVEEVGGGEGDVEVVEEMGEEEEEVGPPMGEMYEM